MSEATEQSDMDKVNEGDNVNKANEEPEDEESKAEISFYPPIYIQRYNRVSRTLEKLIEAQKEKCQSDEKFTILEAGCAEMKMVIHLKTIPGLEKIILLDIDKDLLFEHKSNAAPFPIERLRPRTTPFKTEIYAGCITKCDVRVFNVVPKIRAVIGIEIIEHLHTDVLLGFERTVFGLLCPPIVILTTPNSEFNCVFNLEPGKFRHWDHKFEWTRKEFEDWCSGICSQYPEYEFTTEGIGEGEPETRVYGAVSQMAVFTHRDELVLPEASLRIEKYSDILQKDCYKLIEEYEYPFFVDTSTRAEKILKEFNYYANCYLVTNEELHVVSQDSNGETSYVIDYQVKSALKIHKMPKGITSEELREALEGKYIFRENELNEPVVVIPIPQQEYSDDEFENEEMPDMSKVNLHSSQGNEITQEESWD